MQLFRHPEVEDYFREVDARRLDAQTCARIVDHYEDGDVVFLGGVSPDIDRAFLETVSSPSSAILKKIKAVALPDIHDAVRRRKLPARDPNAPRNSPHDQYRRLLDEVFSGDAGRLGYFIDQVKALNRFLDDLGRTVFAQYRILKPSITWRIADTINENLHVDVYDVDMPDHHLRIFVNLDATWRIWHTSHRLDWLVRNGLSRLPADFLATATPGRICHRLNFEMFGGFERSGREGSPKHIAFFAPGDVWLVDSRKVSHQIFFGRRAASTEMQVDKASMRDPAKHYLRCVEDARAAA